MNRRATLKFRLYIAGETENSLRAIANLSAFCRDYLHDRHEIEIVDVSKEPKRALEDHILMTPTLLKLAPSPKRKIIGTLKDIPTVLDALALEARVLAA
jgi:circadian clock protein KaiB